MSTSKTQELDRDHVAVADQPTPEEVVGEPQYVPEPEKGAGDERTVKTRSKSTAGRHVTGADGFDVAKRRKKYRRRRIRCREAPEEGHS
jgi:hypothetical protein